MVHADIRSRLPNSTHSEKQPLIRQRLKRAVQRVHAAALAQFSKQRAGRILVGLVRVGGIGPDRVINNLRGFFQIDVQRGFADVEALLQALVASLADFGVGCVAGMMLGKRAKLLRRIGGGVRFHELRLNWRRNSSRSFSSTDVSGTGSAGGGTAFRVTGGTTGETRSLCRQVGQTSRSAGK